MQRMATPVDVHFLSGETFCGAVIRAVERYAIVISVDGEERCIFKHALAWSRLSAEKNNENA
jgi:sRNA-binding regulator protein Hfq